MTEFVRAATDVVKFVFGVAILIYISMHGPIDPLTTGEYLILSLIAGIYVIEKTSAGIAGMATILMPTSKLSSMDA